MVCPDVSSPHNRIGAYLLSNTTIWWIDIYIYYIDNNYMFRHFSLAIFRLNNCKNLVSSYTRLAYIVYSGEVRGEVGTRSRMCCVGWVVWVHVFWYFCYSRLI